jgi:hypothetical protein
MRIRRANVEQMNHPSVNIHPAQAKRSVGVKMDWWERMRAQPRKIRTTKVRTRRTAWIAWRVLEK